MAHRSTIHRRKQKLGQIKPDPLNRFPDGKFKPKHEAIISSDPIKRKRVMPRRDAILDAEGNAYFFEYDTYPADKQLGIYDLYNKLKKTERELAQVYTKAYYRYQAKMDSLILGRAALTIVATVLVLIIIAAGLIMRSVII